MKAVFLDRSTFPNTINIKPNDEFDEWIEYDLTTPSETVERCLGATVVITNKAPVTRAQLAQLPLLKLIAVTATGVNNIDLDACREFDITVVNAVDYGTDSVSEHALMLMLAMARNLKSYLAANESKHWSDSPFFHDPVAPINTLAGKNLTIVGRGTLGRGLADKARAMGMNVIFAERQSSHSIRPGYTEFTSALAQADFLSLHCSLTPDTHFLINTETLAQLKPSCVLINTGRGPLVNEDDLFRHLTSGQLAGAALDVTQTEPPAHSDTIWQLSELPNVIITPHVAWAAEESMQRLIDQILDKVSHFLSGKDTANLAQ